MGEISEYQTDSEIAQINSQGYDPKLWRGSGHTRDVFKASFKKDFPEKEGYFEKEVALKVTKEKISEDSICTLINLSKIKNPNIQEIEYFKHFDDHPNIASIRDVFTIKSPDDNIRYVTVEDWMDGLTTEEFVNNIGPLNNYSALKLAAATLRALAYTHHKTSDPWIMRDVKPSNIMDDNELYIRFTDMQNGKYKSMIQPQLLATHGGTAYTHPRILNSFMKNEESSCDIDTDIYAWGATMYYALTGTKIFDYTIEKYDDGIPVNLGYKTIFASVMLENIPKSAIERDEHNINLIKKMKNVPEDWRPIIYDCMYWGNEQYAIKDIVRDIRDIDSDNMFKESWHSISTFIKKQRF